MSRRPSPSRPERPVHHPRHLLMVRRQRHDHHRARAPRPTADISAHHRRGSCCPPRIPGGHADGSKRAPDVSTNRRSAVPPRRWSAAPAGPHRGHRIVAVAVVDALSDVVDEEADLRLGARYVGVLVKIGNALRREHVFAEVHVPGAFPAGPGEHGVGGVGIEFGVRGSYASQAMRGSLLRRQHRGAVRRSQTLTAAAAESSCLPPAGTIRRQTPDEPRTTRLQISPETIAGRYAGRIGVTATLCVT